MAETYLKRLAEIGIEDEADLLLWAPKKYQDNTHPLRRLKGVQMGQTNVFVLKVTTVQLHKKNERLRVSIRLIDEAGQGICATAWSDFRAWKAVEPRANVAVRATVTVWNGTMQLESPELIAQSDVGRLVSVYKGKAGRISGTRIGEEIRGHFTAVRQRAIGKVVAAIGLDEHEIAERIGFPSLAHWFNDLHFPRTMEAAEAALSKVDELAVLQIAEHARQVARRPAHPESVIAVDDSQLKRLAAKLPYPLTSDQRNAVREIVRDLRGAKPMRRLLSGDVGTGKTLAFAIPAFAAAHAGAKVAVVVPNAVLVDKTIKEFAALDPSISVIGVLAGKNFDTSARIVVSTTALIKAAVRSNWMPDLVIVDEQHKLSQAQREALCADHTNLLEASATPIPRSLALVSHGGYDITELRECPVVKDLRTRLILPDDTSRMFGYIRMLVDQGHQVAVVYPRVKSIVESGDDDDLDEELDLEGEDTPEDARTVEDGARQWEKVLPGRIAVLHGGMERERKLAALDAMHEGRACLLVASTAIELGVTLPNLRVIVVVSPDRFGLSQLHQLRGRVSRLGGVGYCFLYSQEAMAEDARARLDAFCRISDGFKLAEADLDKRGAGNFAAGVAKQTGSTASMFPGRKVSIAGLISVSQSHS